MKTKVSPVASSDYTLVTQYLGYSNKEDITNLPAGYLVAPSLNVISNPANRFGIRQGYAYDGVAAQKLTNITGVDASFDWITSFGLTRNMRAFGGTLGALQFRYVATGGEIFPINISTGSSTVNPAVAGAVYWIDVFPAVVSGSNYSFTTRGDTNTLNPVMQMIAVNGSTNVYEWSGAVSKVASTTATTIVVASGSGFNQTGALVSQRNLLINGITYTYTTLTGNTFSGVAPSPAAVVANTLVTQGVVINPIAGMTGIDATFAPANCSVLYNQLYLGSATRNDIYVSKAANYSDFTNSSPRNTFEGLHWYFRGNNPKFIPQEDSMYVSSGKDYWDASKRTTGVTAAGATVEDFFFTALKTSANQGAISQTAIFNVKNSVYFINNEPSLDELGRQLNNFSVPQAANYSDPIKNLFDSYDFTNASGIYYKYNIYIAVPTAGVVLVYNIAKKYWEPPQTIPVSRFSIIGGQLYGHSYTNPITFRLFTGYNDDGLPINAKAYFSFNNYGTRAYTKIFTEYYVEGYILGNTTLNCDYQFETDGNAAPVKNFLSGSNPVAVAIRSSNASLGSLPLGQAPLGGQTTTNPDLPPKFRYIFTNQPDNFYEMQAQFSSYGIDFRWEILAFGPAVRKSQYNNARIKN